jgi:hypothetical protein
MATRSGGGMCSRYAARVVGSDRGAARSVELVRRQVIGLDLGEPRSARPASRGGADTAAEIRLSLADGRQIGRRAEVARDLDASFSVDGGRRLRERLDAEVAAHLARDERARRAVGEAPLHAELLDQARREAAAEDRVGDLRRQEVRIATGEPHGPVRICVCGVGRRRAARGSPRPVERASHFGTASARQGPVAEARLDAADGGGGDDVTDRTRMASFGRYQRSKSRTSPARVRDALTPAVDRQRVDGTRRAGREAALGDDRRL